MVNFYDNVEDSLLKFAVIFAVYDGKYVFCKHKQRDTLEIPGGHREKNESIEDTAKRELYEETGAIDFDIEPVCVYSVTEKGNFNGEETFGMIYFADVRKFESELHSEIEKIIITDTLPTRWTYPTIQPILFEYVNKIKYKNMIKTKRLELVRFDKKYAKDLYELWSDYEVIKYTYMPQLNSVDECSEKIEMFINYTDDEVLNNFIILLDDKAIGIIGSPIIDKDNSIFGLYYQLIRKYWGNGYISEALEIFMKHILSKFPNAEFNAEVVSENPASEAILRKMGFKKIGVEKNGFTLNEFTLDIIKFINQK